MPILTSQSKSIRWLFAELSVVILGILIAFQVEEWRSESIDRDEELAALGAILLDLENEVSLLNTFLESAERQVSALSLMVDLGSNAKSNDDEWVANIYREAVLTRLWQPASTTYEGLRSSGNLNLLTDPELLSSIIRYYDANNTSLNILINDMRDARDSFLLVLGRDIHFLATDEFSNDTASLKVNIVPPIENMPRHPEFYAHYGSYAYRVSVLRIRLEGKLDFNSRLHDDVRKRIQLLSN
ncbi:MAG: hypothetical protein R3F50_06665 [Gammaproteobacteria bacterium]